MRKKFRHFFCLYRWIKELEDALDPGPPDGVSPLRAVTTRRRAGAVPRRAAAQPRREDRPSAEARLKARRKGRCIVHVLVNVSANTINC